MKNKKLLFTRLFGFTLSLMFMLSVSYAWSATEKDGQNGKLIQDKSEQGVLVKDQEGLNTKAALFEDGFEGGTLPAVWTVDNIAGGNLRYITGSSSAHTDSSYVYFAGYGWGYASPNDVRLYTPALTVDTTTLISFWQKGLNVGFNEIYVEISDDGGATWDVVYIPFPGSSDYWEYVEFLVPEEYYGKDIHVGFHYFDDDPYGYGQALTYWWLDDVYVGDAFPYIYDFALNGEENSPAVIDDVAGTVDIEVYKSADVTALTPEFVLAPGAQLSPTTTDFEVPTDFTNPVDYVVTTPGSATKGDKVYTVTVTPAAEFLTGNDILDANLGPDVKEMEIDADAHTVTAKILYDSTLTITPDFVISERATIDPASGVEQDFTNPITYTVTAEDGTAQEWVVTVTQDDPEEGNELLAIEFPNQVGDVWFDNYARRVEAQIMYDSSLVMTPTAFEISPYAVADPAGDEELDFTDPVMYEITSEAGVAVDWKVTVTNIDPSMEAMITGFDVTALIDWDWANDTALVAWVNDTLDLSSLKPMFDISFGATISDTTAAADFSAGPVTYTVTAQDGETMVHYSVAIVHEEDATPMVELIAADTVDNVTGMVHITSDFDGQVALVMMGEDLDSANDYQAVVVDIAADDTVEVMPYGLEEGWYVAWAINEFSEFMSEMSEDSVYVEMGTEEVENIAALWDAWSWEIEYVVTGEVLLSAQMDFQGKKYIQDASDAIMIWDPSAVITTSYDVGDGITGLTGTLSMDGGVYMIQPTEDPGAATSTGNTLEPVVAHIMDLMDDPDFYQSHLVKVEKAILVTDSTTFTNATDYELQQAGSEDSFTLSTMFEDTDLIGTAIPTNSIDVMGIAGVDAIYPRNAADITDVTVFEFYGEDIMFGEVEVGDSVVSETGFGNIGVGDMVISDIEIHGSGEFTLLTDSTYPYTLAPYTGFMVEVAYEPVDVGDDMAYLVISYNTDQMDSVMISGTGFEIVIAEVDAPYQYGFEDWDGNTFTSGEWFVEGGWGVDADNSDWVYEGRFSIYLGGWMAFENSPVYSPWIDLEGIGAPVLTYQRQLSDYTGVYPQVWITTDNVTWEPLFIEDGVYPGYTIFTKAEVSLADYVGEKVRFWFDYNDSEVYWQLDDINVFDKPTTPVFMVDGSGNFGTTAVGEEEALTVDLVNGGVSFLNVDTMFVHGESPEFMVAYDPVVESYEEFFGDFTVTFMSDVAGTFEDSIFIQYSDARNDSLGMFVHVMSMAVDCENAAVATEGTHEAPGAPMWYSFTPDQDMVVKVKSMTGDTRLFIYDGCDPLALGEEGNDEIAFSDDISGSDFTSYVHFFAAAGETYNIYWHDGWDAAPFEWMLETDTTAGAVCEMAIPVTLPAVDVEGTTEFAGDYYNDPSPCNDYYLDGNDIVYTFTLDEASFLTGEITGNYVGMHVIRGVLPNPYDLTPSISSCVAFASDGVQTVSFSNRFAPAGTYYVVVSTWPSPQFSEFTMSLSAEVAHREATIAEIQGFTDVTPFEGTFVITEGIVTAVYNNGYYLQDGEGEWNGIQVYDPDNFESVAVGDELRVDGRALEYYDMTNIEDIVSVEVLSSDNDLPAPAVIAPGDVGEPWEGVLVKLEGVYIASDYNQYDEFLVEGADNDTVMIDPTIFQFDEVLNIGQMYDITGLVNYSYGNFRIRPRSIDDVYTGVADLEANFGFSMYPNPTDGQFTLNVNSESPQDLTVEIVNIEGRTIYNKSINDVVTFSESINVSDFAKGIYFLRIFNEESVRVEKLIIK